MSEQSDVLAERDRHPVEGRRTRLGDIQGLRAVAVILVVVYHAGLPVSGGFVGVDVFFAISGFVITRLLIAEIARTGTVSLGRFYARRVRRLLPALAAMTLVTLIASAVIQSPVGAQQNTALVGLGASSWTANLVLYRVTGGYFDSAAETIPLLHVWSLAIEEQFYLFFPSLMVVGALLARRARNRLATTFVLLAGVFVLSFALSLWLSDGRGLPMIGKPATAAFYSSPTRSWEFVSGALVALWATHRRHGKPATRLAYGIATTGAVGLVGSALSMGDSLPWPGWAAVFPVGATVALIVAGQLWPEQAITRALGVRPMQWLGDVSYSWYLWHWPFIAFTGLLFEGALPKLVAALASLGIATASYYWLEQPIRHMDRQGGRQTLALAVSCVCIPATAAGGLWVGANKQWGQTEVQAFARQVDPVPVGYQLGCHSSVPIGERDLARCRFGPADGAVTFLLGDSNGGQYAEGLVSAAEPTGRNVVLATMSGCPFIDLDITTRGRRESTCRTFYTRSMAWLVDQAPATTVLGAASEAVLAADVVLTDPRSGRTASSVTAKALLWQEALERTIKELQDAGHRVVIIQTMPHLQQSGREGLWWDPDLCTLVVVHGDAEKCGTSVLLETEDRRQAPVLAAEKRVVEATGASYIEVRDALCPDGICAANRDGNWVFRDGLHISTGESERFAKIFVTALGPAS